MEKVWATGIEVFMVDGTSAYLPGPDGERIELLSYPLNDTYEPSPLQWPILHEVTLVETPLVHQRVLA